MRSTNDPAGSTPLDDDELADLIPTHLTTRAQLNAWEQANINDAMRSVLGRRNKPSMLDVDTLMDLHRRMFGSTWRWAGVLRTTAKNIGVPVHTIAEQLGNLVADAGYWVEHQTYQPDEMAVRYHHRLVSIHLFPNGNGRHARLATDLLLEAIGEPRFSWGAAGVVEGDDPRPRYLSALREADGGELAALMAFVRS